MKVISMTEHRDPTAPTGSSLSLPSEHQDHASIFAREMEIQLAKFESGILAITTEMDGQQIAYEEKLHAMERDHKSSMKQLLDRKVDLERGKRMAAAALDVAGE